MVEVDDKVGVVNENGLYLGGDFKATTTPFGWTLEAVTQQGSSGYRFADYDGETLKSVAHLSNALSFMNYTTADAASVWQFISADALAESNENEEFEYHITSMRTEANLIGSKIGYDGSELTIDSDQNLWKIVNLNTNNGSCNLINENGDYLSISGTNLILSDTPRAFFIYSTSLSGVVGYRIAMAASSGASMVNLNANGKLALLNSLNNGGLWQIAKPVTTDSPSTRVQELEVSVANGQIFVRDVDSFDVYNTSGVKVQNRNLPKGVYLVKTALGVGKVMVLN